jgi:hypothetical protein
MSKNQKYIIIISLFFSTIILVGFFVDFNQNKNYVENKSIEQQNFKEIVSIKNETTKQEKEKIDNPIQNEKELNVSLIVLDKTYNISINEGNTVYDVMKNLQNSKENNFSFEGKEYPSLGVFVEKINGVKGESGKYWIYYVNDKQAQVGVSNYVLKEGDIISWRQE